MASGFKNFDRVMASIAGRTKEYRGAGFRSVQKEVEVVKTRIRNVVQTAFPRNRRAAGAIRGKLYGTANSSSPAGIVYSKFGRKEGGTFIDYIAPRVFGATVRPRNANYLEIPFTGKGISPRRARQQLDMLQAQGKLRVVPSGGVLLLVHDTRRRSTIVGMLVKTVRYPRRADLASLISGGASRMASNIKAAI